MGSGLVEIRNKPATINYQHSNIFSKELNRFGACLRTYHLCGTNLMQTCLPNDKSAELCHEVPGISLCKQIQIKWPV